ncbi:CCA tRNA nucleotidyltransferase [Spirochaeta lutea]|uniref:CCA tRNA nucleotidyltransferase n=1 Tax=Spirochaeta lutea TaxID=1480694 RepID=UPI00055E4328|nr:CCA tRNA nucleotidyltransferase [Spirochaeta lutea]
MNKPKLPNFILSFAQVFIQHGFQLFLVGGAVRNIGLGITPKDWDFASDAEPEEVISLFKRVIPTGISHGTVTVLYRSHHFEVTTFRIDGSYTDNRRPDSVEFTKDIREDLDRRDFTINSMAIQLPEIKFFDPHNGLNDLSSKIIRCVGDPNLRFKEDALRILRAIRFSSQLGFTIEAQTWQGMKNHRDGLASVSIERIRDEFTKIILSDQASSGVRQLEEIGLYQYFIPEISKCVEADLFTHLVNTVQALPITATLPLRLAAFLHDIEKPTTESCTSDGAIHYLGHDQKGAETVQAILTRLRYPNQIVERTRRLVQHHMFEYTLTHDSAIRRLIARVGKDLIFDLILLKRADILGKFLRVPNRAPAAILQIDDLEGRIKEILEGSPPLTVKDLAINGRQLMEHIKVKPGPHIGLILDELLETVLADPAMNQAEKLLSLAKNFYETRINGPAQKSSE